MSLSTLLTTLTGFLSRSGRETTIDDEPLGLTMDDVLADLSYGRD